MPSGIQDGYDYAVQIKQNWDSSITTASRLFQDNRQLLFMPDVELKHATNFYYAFSECSSLMQIATDNWDTSSATNFNRAFYHCYALTELPDIDLSGASNISEMFIGCQVTSVPNYNTSSATNMKSMFANCNKIVDFPILNTSHVTTMQTMFTNCSSLSNDSLNNILYMCAHTTNSYTATKTLAYIGLSSAQAAICQTLSNYSDFTSAGWTTGY